MCWQLCGVEKAELLLIWPTASLRGMVLDLIAWSRTLSVRRNERNDAIGNAEAACNDS